VAFLFTDAEEFGLAGASAVCRRLPPTINVINLDGLDDGGRFQVIDRHGIPPRGLAPHLVAALLGAAHQLGLPAERRTLPIGVLADHVPFVEAGMAAVTVMRGTWESLTRVHLPGDNTSRLSADGVVHTTSLVSAALALLREKGVA
jgi:Zn-dependent M28 family amino/carboxypeptidase